MQNPTRRVKQFRRPLSSSIRPPDPLPGTASDTVTRFNVNSMDTPADANSSSTQHRPLVGVQPHNRSDTHALVRGVVLLALVVVTFVLYVILWELERTSFASVPKSSNVRSVLSGTSDAGVTPTRYPPTVFQDGPGLSSSGEVSEPDRIGRAVSSSIAGRTVSMPNTWPPPITQVPEDHNMDDLAAKEQEKVDDRTHTKNVVSVSSFDSTYCHGACRFLLPVRVGEQESKARMHFGQLLTLARRLNRTIVLPHVGKSRMSACSKWPFDAYYDTTALARGDSPDLPLTMDLQRFAKWIDERPAPPSSFVVSITSMHQRRRDVPRAPMEPEDVPFIVDREDIDPKILSCLASRLARLRSSLPEMTLSIAFCSGVLKTASDASIRLVQLLSNTLDMDILDADAEFGLLTGPGYDYIPRYINTSGSLSLADVDVLVLDYDLRHPLFTGASTQPIINLHYSPAFYDLADRLADNLGPFLGVHWRMETVPEHNLAWCAAALVSTLRGFLQDDVTGKNVRHVWLATDHPRPLSSFTNGVHTRFPADDTRLISLHDDVGSGQDRDGSPSPMQKRGGGPTRKSSTFTALSSEHDNAIAMLAEAFQPGGDLGAWSLTDLAEQLRRYPYVEGRLDVNDTLLGDPGVFGILDKLVIVQASVFVSGSADCGKASSFSRQVIEARQESFEAERGKGAIRNVVDYFGKW